MQEIQDSWVLAYRSLVAVLNPYAPLLPAGLMPLKRVVQGSVKTVAVAPARIRRDLILLENGKATASVWVGQLSYVLVKEPQRAAGADAASPLVRLEAPALVWQSDIRASELKAEKVARATKLVQDATATIAELQQASVRSAAALKSALDAAAAGDAAGELSDLGALMLEGRRIADEIKRQTGLQLANEQQVSDLQQGVSSSVYNTHTFTPHLYLSVGLNRIALKSARPVQNDGTETVIVHIARIHAYKPAPGSSESTYTVTD